MYNHYAFITICNNHGMHANTTGYQLVNFICRLRVFTEVRLPVLHDMPLGGESHGTMSRKALVITVVCTLLNNRCQFSGPAYQSTFNGC